MQIDWPCSTHETCYGADPSYCMGADHVSYPMGARFGGITFRNSQHGLLRYRLALDLGG